MTSSAAPRKRRSIARIVLTVLGTLLALALAAGLALAYFVGPMFGFWLVKPSPQRYAEHVAATLDTGYHAQGQAWTDARARLTAAGASAQSYEELYPVIKEVTKVAGGKHSFFRTPTEAAANDADARATFRTPEVTTQGRITTVTVPDLGGVSKDQESAYIAAGAKGIEKAAPNTCGWVVDLRGNTGGTMYPMFAALYPLLPDGPAMTFQPRQGQGFPVQIKEGGAGVGVVVSKTDVTLKVPADQRVAVLYDEKVASSGEAVATAFRGLPNVRSFGTETAGYTSANSVHQLPDGARLVLTGSVYVDRNGVSLDEQPMKPDQVTSAADAPAAARTWLTETCR